MFLAGFLTFTFSAPSHLDLKQDNGFFTEKFFKIRISNFRFFCDLQLRGQFWIFTKFPSPKALQI